MGVLVNKLRNVEADGRSYSTQDCKQPLILTAVRLLNASNFASSSNNGFGSPSLYVRLSVQYGESKLKILAVLLKRIANIHPPFCTVPGAGVVVGRTGTGHSVQVFTATPKLLYSLVFHGSSQGLLGSLIQGDGPGAGW